MGDLFPVSREEMIAEVKREIAMRKRVYPLWVADGKLKQDRAARQIKIMEAVLQTLEE